MLEKLKQLLTSYIPTKEDTIPEPTLVETSKVIVNKKLKDHDFSGLTFTDFDSILDTISEDEMNTFLQLGKDVAKNETFAKVLTFLINENLRYTALEANDKDMLLYSRGSINGILSVKDTIEYIRTVYEERHTTEEPYDKHEIM